MINFRLFQISEFNSFCYWFQQKLYLLCMCVYVCFFFLGGGGGGAFISRVF